jgi:FAD/FMN-containing dehydrogenase
VLLYAGNDASRRFFADLETLASGDRGLDGVYGQVIAQGEAWAFVIQAVRFVDDSAPDDLAGLAFDDAKTTMMDRFAFDTLVDTMNAERARAGFANLRRIWLDAFLPAPATEDFVGATLAHLTPRDLGPAGFILVFPIRNRDASYALRLPAARRVHLFDVLSSLDPGDDAVESRRSEARRAYERARAIGGTLYPIGSTPMSPEDWAHQFGALHERFAGAKQMFDPQGLLAPGAQIYRTRGDT